MAPLMDPGTHPDEPLDRIGRDGFVRVLAAHYRDVGWWVESAGTAGSPATFDGGVDLRLRRDAQVVLVRCRYWNARQVTHDAVHALLGVLVTEGATGAILVTGGAFTDAAIAAAQHAGRLKLIDGRGLRDMLGDDAFAPPDAAPVPSTPVRRAASRPHRGGGLRLLLIGIALLCAIGFVLVVREMLARTASTAGVPPEEPAPVTPQSVPLSPQPNADERRASQRKADEAARTSEDTAPQM